MFCGNVVAATLRGGRQVMGWDRFLSFEGPDGFEPKVSFCWAVKIEWAKLLQSFRKAQETAVCFLFNSNIEHDASTWHRA